MRGRVRLKSETFYNENERYKPDHETETLYRGDCWTEKIVDINYRSGRKNETSFIYDAEGNCIEKKYFDKRFIYRYYSGGYIDKIEKHEGGNHLEKVYYDYRDDNILAEIERIIHSVDGNYITRYFLIIMVY